MEIDRVTYFSSENLPDPEPTVGVTVKTVLDTGLTDNDVLSFTLPSDPDLFTDLNTLMLHVNFKVVKQNGDPLGTADEDPVFLDFNGIHALFQSCTVKMNNVIMTSMNAYSYSTLLCRFLGMTQANRRNWATFDGSNVDIALGSANVVRKEGDATGEMFYRACEQVSKSKLVSLWGRVYADVCSSSRQYLPPNVTLTLDFRRAPGSFSLACSKDTKERYRIKIISASLYAKRLSISSKLVPKSIESLSTSANLLFNRLDVKMCSIPKGSQVWRIHNVMSDQALPNRIYVGFIDQRSVYGDLSLMSGYFEHMNLSSFNVKLSGRDLMLEKFEPHFVNSDNGDLDISKSEARTAYLSLLEICGNVHDQLATPRLSYVEWMRGLLLYSLEFGRVGSKHLVSGSTGVLDIELTFGGEGTPRQVCALIFTEQSAVAQIERG